ncbi:MAG TPA: redoxin domain-containing protein [Phycisphaerales bacterium]|nr:redoxin domain-containing protein [Phycisphaerales bacterium]
MRLSSMSSALSTVFVLALSAAAQPPAAPATPPAAPATPPAGGAVEMSDTPKDDPEARRLLTECVAAISKMGPVSFKGRYAMSGAAMVIDGKGEIRFVRNNAAPQDSQFWGRGKLQMPALDRPEFHVSRYVDDKGAKRIAWQDDAAKAVFDRPEGPGPDGKETDGGRQAGLVLRSMLLPAFVSPTAPFADELKEAKAGADVIKSPCIFLPDETIGGEPCKVVKVIFKKGQAERTIWISAKDKLPRKYEQFRNGLPRFWEITDLVMLESDQGKNAARMPLPDGYRSDKNDLGGAPLANTPPATGPTIPVAMSGGPQVGQLAPEFNLKTAEGAEVKFADLKGQTVVATFGGSLFPQSWSSQSTAAASLAAKPVKVVGLACRETDPARAVKAFADAKGVGQLLLDGDDAAKLYNVRGFPSTVVIGPDGKVAAFFEGPVTDADLSAAVSSVASAPK